MKLLQIKSCRNCYHLTYMEWTNHYICTKGKLILTDELSIPEKCPLPNIPPSFTEEQVKAILEKGVDNTEYNGGGKKKRC